MPASRGSRPTNPMIRRAILSCVVASLLSSSPITAQARDSDDRGVASVIDTLLPNSRPLTKAKLHPALFSRPIVWPVKASGQAVVLPPIDEPQPDSSGARSIRESEKRRIRRAHGNKMPRSTSYTQRPPTNVIKTRPSISWPAHGELRLFE